MADYQEEDIPDFREEQYDPSIILANRRSHIACFRRHNRWEQEQLYGTESRSRHPAVKWAQRSDILFITIDLPDTKDVKLKLEPDGKLFFHATSGAENIPYELDISLYDAVDVNESKARIGSRNIIYLIKKAESKWWSRLLKQDGKPPVFLRVDWDKWVDEDEQDEKPGPEMDLGDIDFSNLSMVGEEDEAEGGENDEESDESDTEEEDSTEEVADIYDQIYGAKEVEAKA